MALESVQDYVDYLTDRIGKSDATLRARCLDWIQAAEFFLWGRRDWWWKQFEVDVAMASGTASYSLGTKINRLLQVRVGSGAPLKLLGLGAFRQLCTSNVVSGTPVLWCRLADLSGGYPAFEVWPVPDASGTLKVLYERAPGDALSDSDASFSGLPPSWRWLVLQGALVSLHQHYGQVEAEQLARVAYEEGVSRMELEDDRVGRQKGGWM